MAAGRATLAIVQRIRYTAVSVPLVLALIVGSGCDRSSATEQTNARGGESRENRVASNPVPAPQEPSQSASQPASTVVSQINSNSQAPATTQPSSPAGQTPPPVQIDPAVLDLGTVRPGEKASGSVLIKNVGAQPLRILTSRSSCECTSVNLSNTVIAPGESVPLQAEFKTTSGQGQKKAAIRVLFEGYSLIEVPVQAYVAFPVRAVPAFISALPNQAGERTLTGEYVVDSLDQRPFRILAVNGGPVPYVDFDPQNDEPRPAYRIKWDFSVYDPITCQDASGNRLPGWLVIETDRPDSPIFDLEVRHECNRRAPIQPTDEWVLPDKRALLGVLKPGESTEIELFMRWMPQRSQSDLIQTVISESPQFRVEFLGSEPAEDGRIFRVRVTPSDKHHGLIYGIMRFHSNRQNAPVTVIGTVR